MSEKIGEEQLDLKIKKLKIQNEIENDIARKEALEEIMKNTINEINNKNPLLNDDITICAIGTITITAHNIKKAYATPSATFPPTVRGCLSERYKSLFFFLNILINPTPS